MTGTPFPEQSPSLGRSSSCRRRELAQELARQFEAELRQYVDRLAAALPRGPARKRWLAEVEESMAAIKETREALATPHDPRGEAQAEERSP